MVWFVLKIVSLFNAPVAVGMKIASGGVGLIRRGFSEVVEAGEAFKQRVESSDLDDRAREFVLDAFKRSHMEHQSRDTQHAIKQLTN